MSLSQLIPTDTQFPAKTTRDFENIVGLSRVFQDVLRRAAVVADTDSAVLISGETGTGKECIAQMICELSRRRERPLVSVNCAALPLGLVESELFGHEKGAFTGAISRRQGRFELADQGTIFLDEIGDVSLDVQVKLLRVLERFEFERVGGTKTIKVNVRIIAATNRPLADLKREDKFRADLYYRLNVFHICLPPLRDRKEDIPLLAQYFLEKYAKRLDRKIRKIGQKTVNKLLSYSWPGNVRELEHTIERAVISCTGPFLEIVEELSLSSNTHSQRGSPASNGPYFITKDEKERLFELLKEVRNNHSKAAQILGISRMTLWRWLRRHSKNA